MPAPKKAKLYTNVFYVDCPHCGEAIASPDDGSHLWEVQQIQTYLPDRTITCHTCRNVVRIEIPTTIRVQ